MRHATQIGLLLSAGLLLFTAQACSDDTETGQPAVDDGPCPAGTAGCPCTTSRTCEDSSLRCDFGFCAPLNCDRGSSGCACGIRGECDSVSGVPMTCSGNICEPTNAIAAGDLGGGCAADGTCSGGTADQPLDCVNGLCEQAGCPSGTLGCPCGPYGMCETFEEQQMRCVQGTCQIGACAAGTVGCRCDDDACSGSLSCLTGFCRTADIIHLSVSDASVRSCDLLLSESGGPSHPEVSFGATVRGAHIYRTPKLSLSFISRTDGVFSGTVATIQPKSTWSGSIDVVHSFCYDRLGQPVAGAEVRLQ